MKKAVFNVYVDYVCSNTHTKRAHLFKKDKRPTIATSRFLLYTMCKERPMTVACIIELMSGEGYKTTRSSVEHGLNKISNSEDVDVINFIKNFKKKCKI